MENANIRETIIEVIIQLSLGKEVGEIRQEP
ncbi:hypothetical protein UABAM_04371 [Candidatus Uabimicrobium amorphum]|uniref:Uncharacterized protein n=1 Tax=Uabimicrobium amorphum TaxID=2596890 RepID=A0A5S9F4P2_UABAM|nr:hypothetical protein UABAM_04371 [Candidatus Uabimicrobium amorphum]